MALKISAGNSRASSVGSSSANPISCSQWGMKDVVEGGGGGGLGEGGGTMGAAALAPAELVFIHWG